MTSRRSRSRTTCRAASGARRASRSAGCSTRSRRRSRCGTWSSPPGFEPRLFAAEPAIAKPICMTWDHRGRLWIAESVDYPNTKHPGTAGPRPDHDLRGHRRRRPGRQVHGLRRGAQHPHEPALRRRRRDRPPGARHAVPQGHRRRRQGRRPQGALHRLGHRRHPRRAEQPPLGLRQLGLGDRRLLGVPRHGRRRALTRRPGVLPVQARRLEARVPPQHEQQLVGRRLQRGRAGLRLDGQRLPERLPADPQPLLRGGARLVAAGPAQHRGRTSSSSRSPTRSGRSTSTAASPPRPAMRSTPRGPIRRSTGTRPPSSPSRPGTWSPRSRSTARRATSPRTTAGTCWPATTSGPRRSRPRSAPTATSGSSTGTTTSSSTTPRRAGSRPARGTPTRPRSATRSTAGSTGSSTRTPGHSTPPSLDPGDAKGLVAALGNDNQFWRMHAQRLLVERGKTDVVPALIERVGDRSVDAIGLNVGAIHALWTLQRPRAHSTARIGGGRGGRRGARSIRRRASGATPCRSCRGTSDRPSAILSAGLLTDPDPQVRLAALLALADQPPSDEAAKAVADVLRGGLAGDDHWLADAATAAAARNDRAFLKAIAATGARPTAGGPARRSCGSSSGWPSTGRAAARSIRSAALLASLRRRRRRDRRGPAPRHWPAAGPRAGPRSSTRRRPRRSSSSRWSLPSAARGQLVRLVSPWGDPVLAGDQRRDRRDAAEVGAGRVALRVAAASTPPGSSSSCGRPATRPRASCSA